MTLPIFSPSAVEIGCEVDWSAWFFETTGGILTGLNFAGRIDEAVAIVPMGYAAQDCVGKEKQRKTLDEIIEFV